MDKLEALYEKHFFPSLDNFWKIIQRKHIDVSFSDVENFINQQPITQIFKVRHQKQGHITAFSPKERVQMDIIIMDKFFRSNNGFKYILAFIDVFTRKGYAIPMATKSIRDTSNALEHFCERYFVPEVINCDNDSSFTGGEFQKVIEDNNILFVPNDLDNHHHLGIIDAFVKNIKNSIYKVFKFKNTINWIDILPQIIKNYNATPHVAIDDIKPENAHLPENQTKILLLNLDKTRNNVNSNLFKVGDRVRKRVKSVIKNRSYNPNYSSEVYTIERIEGNKFFLEGLKKPAYQHDLLIVPNVEEPEPTHDELKEAIKADKIRRKLNEVGIDTKNVVVEKRERRAKKFFDD